LKRAKALGDYLIVGITADSFDLNRGKINVQQSLMERIEAVKATGIADEIIVEEYEGQKIDDIRRYDIDIFTVGSDWIGHFDYLKEFCQVIYLERTEGISSTELRSEYQELRIGLVGEPSVLMKFERESHFVNGITISCFYTTVESDTAMKLREKCEQVISYEELLDKSDAVFIASKPQEHYNHIKQALTLQKHVLALSPVTISMSQYNELLLLAKNNECVLMDALKTAYSTAYTRLLLMAKSGKIGKVVSIDATCTSLEALNHAILKDKWNSLCGWGPTAMLPIFQILGTDFTSVRIYSHIIDDSLLFDSFTKIDFTFPKAVASLKVGKGVKSEGELIISGTYGYIYVPAPWWKTDYFEIRYENPIDNQRFFYQLEGEGFRYEQLSFLKAIKKGQSIASIESKVSEAIVSIMEKYFNDQDIIRI
jgi:choline-phosphate cytidylyltransferase